MHGGWTLVESLPPPVSLLAPLHYRVTQSDGLGFTQVIKKSALKCIVLKHFLEKMYFFALNSLKNFYLWPNEANRNVQKKTVAKHIF